MGAGSTSRVEGLEKDFGRHSPAGTFSGRRQKNKSPLKVF
jgi:hypothetical protein